LNLHAQRDDMGKVFINEFKKKLALKNKEAPLGQSISSVNFKTLHDRKIQRFNNGLTKFLLNNEIRKNIRKVNDYTIRIDKSPIMNEYGTATRSYITLSLVELSDEKETWECAVFECDELHESESILEKFDNAQIAIEYFINQVINKQAQ